jgi:membrane protease subunit HflK
VLFIGWLFTGIYIVDPAERGVVLRFGAYTKMTEPGPHWHIPWPIETVQIVNVDEISSFSHKAAMLTQDENIVDVELTVQSRIQDAANYLFQDQTPGEDPARRHRDRGAQDHRRQQARLHPDRGPKRHRR